MRQGNKKMQKSKEYFLGLSQRGFMDNQSCRGLDDSSTLCKWIFSAVFETEMKKKVIIFWLLALGFLSA